MSGKNLISVLVFAIIVLAGIAAGSGIFLEFGEGSFTYESIRGLKVEIYGRGIYQHMPSDVAIQGIAQDYITLFIGIPLLIITLIGYRKNSIRSHYLLSGVLGYFFVTYLFYTAMGMYNALFLCYVVLLALSFFGLFLSIKDLKTTRTHVFSEKTPAKGVGGFLIFNTVAITFLWLGIIVPPLVEGTIYPPELYHFTTLIVQGFDLGLLLPICFVVAVLLYKKRSEGYRYSTVYLGFLSLLMTALTAKIVAMAMAGVNVIPVIVIIPVVNAAAIFCTYLMIKNVQFEKQ
jgi:hypothetical protein